MLTLVLLLLLRQRLAKVPHALAQRLHRLGLIGNGTGKIAIAQGAFRVVHRPFGPAKRFGRAFAFLGALPRQVPTLAVQLVAQRALTVGQPFFQTVAALPFTCLAILSLTLALPLLLAFLLPLLALLSGLALLTGIELLL